MHIFLWNVSVFRTGTLPNNTGKHTRPKQTMKEPIDRGFDDVVRNQSEHRSFLPESIETRENRWKYNLLVSYFQRKCVLISSIAILVFACSICV